MTHAEKVLQLLSDGRTHEHMELYRLGVMAHSRVADLRRRGYRIDCWRDGDNYLYQLLPTLPEAGDSRARGLPASGNAGTAPAAELVGHDGGPAVAPLQGRPRHPVHPPETADGEGEAPGVSPSYPSPARPEQLTVWEAA